MKNRILICVFLLLSFRVYSQSCTLNVSISASSTTICSGNSVTLTATTTGGTGPFTFVWSTGETTPTINVNKGDTYTVTVSDKTPGCQPVKASITIAASTTPNAPTAANVVVCPNSPATLMATAPGGTYQWYTAATGGTFLTSGSTYTTPPINSTTTYYVETTIDNCTSPRTAVTVTLTSKPNVIGATVCSGNVATLMASGGDSYAWYDAATNGNLVSNNASFTTPPLTTTTTYYVVVTTNGCSSERTPVTATVSQPPQPPTSPDQTICAGSTANLHATAASGIFDWYTVPSGGTSLISSPDYTTPPLTVTTTYYVQTSLNGCESPRVPVTVTVTQPPQAPAAQTDSICYNSSTTLTASATPSGTYQWYDALVNGNLLATGDTYTTPVLTNSTTYYVQSVNGPCITARAQVNVIIRPLLAAPSASGAIICSGSVAALTATSSGGTYQWYDAATAGNLLATTATYTTPPLTTTTTYYVQRMLSGCTSPRTQVTVSVLPASAAPTAPGQTICSGSSAALTATSTDDIYAWYDSATGSNLLSSGQVYVTPNLTTTTIYYVETTSQNGCISPRTAVTVTVNSVPSAPTASGATICPGTSASLTASAAAGTTIQWYNAATSGTLLTTGSTYNTPVLSANTTYYVQSVNGSCNSTRTAVTVTITPGTDPEFQYPSGTFCVTSTNPKPVINNPSGGTFSASPAGLVFVSTTTGEINIAASTPGNYVVSFTNNAPCAGTTSASISIVTIANASFSYSGPYCQSGVNPLPAFPAGASAGTFSSSPAGLVFLNTSTGEIDLGKSNGGAYTITNTIATTGGCLGSTATGSVTIDPQVVISAGPNQTVATGSNAQLAGSISGGTTSGTWSGGTGSFSNPSLPNAVYTPGSGEATAVLTLTSADPPGPCGPVSAQVTISFNPEPGQPTAPGVTVCSGSPATLSATAPGGTYRWYDAPTGGTLLKTGPSYTTPLPLTASTTYYVETTVSGVTSKRTAVTATVNALPAAPVAKGAQICTGSSTTLTASGSTNNYRWYDAPIGGNLLDTTNTYTTPALSFNTSYYVEAIANPCTSTRTKVDVTLTPTPNVTSTVTGSICSGIAQNYTITADITTATFNWSRAQVTGISNPAITNQTSATINEALVNTTSAAINVIYVITPISGSCSGPAFNYTVTVYPNPVVTSADTATICNQSTDNYAITFNTPGTSFSWSRAAVPGISNAAVSGQSAPVIREVLFNTTNAPVNVTYIFNYKTSTCDGAPFSLVITVNPTATVTSGSPGIACSGTPLNYVITSNIPGTTYSWSRGAIAGISNPAVSNQTSSTINETLINTGNSTVTVLYNITPIANGCDGTPFRYFVNVNPSVSAPVVNSNSPICVASTVHLSTPTVAGATYLWTGPNGYTSTLQNPDITNVTPANSGNYTLVVTSKGCDSPPTTVSVMVDEPPVADAGPDQVVCILDPQILLNGSITGGTSTGIWTTAGTGTFSPSSNTLNAQYIPSAADKAAGSVMLTLASTSKDDCHVAMDSMTVKFGPLPAVNAGPDQAVCSQDASVKLAGTSQVAGTVTWTTSGTGSFSPTANQLDASYNPTADDVKSGIVTLTLTIMGAGPCYFASDSMTMRFIPPPTVNAGGIRYVLKGNTITLNPTVSTDSVTYLWSPNVDINNNTLKNPVITGDIDRTYTLTVTDTRGCVAQDTTFIKVSPQIIINNTFTPNGDGINDQWVITGLIAYQNATVDIFNRWGQLVFHSVGYPKPWDGTYNGKPLPVGVYYYVINTKLFNQVLSGYVTLIK